MASVFSTDVANGTGKLAKITAHRRAQRTSSAIDVANHGIYEVIAVLSLIRGAIDRK